MLLTGKAYAAGPSILVLGDSLSAAYGIPKEAGWVSLLQDRLDQQGFPHRVINISISGETTAGGLRRLPAALEQYEPDLLVLELGANDGLRAQSLEQMQLNLTEMVRAGQAKGARVLLFEMRIPSNYGPRYTEAFRARFASVAQETGATLQPFFLTEIATDPQAFLEDGIHPSAEVQPRLLDAVWPRLHRLLVQTDGASSQSARRSPQSVH